MAEARRWLLCNKIALLHPSAFVCLFKNVIQLPVLFAILEQLLKKTRLSILAEYNEH